MVGATCRALQIAADALAAAGGGTLEIGPGTYTMEDALRSTSRVCVIGSGPQTVLRTCDGPTSALPVDADYGQRKRALKDVKPFRVGMGIVVGDDHCIGWHETTARIAQIARGCLHIDEYLVSDCSADHGGTSAMPRASCP